MAIVLTGEKGRFGRAKLSYKSYKSYGLLVIQTIQIIKVILLGPRAGSIGLSKNDAQLSAKAGDERQETQILLPHVACFTEREIDGIGRRTQRRVIRVGFPVVGASPGRSQERSGPRARTG